MTESFDRIPRSDGSIGRRRLVRIPALVLVAVLAVAWVPCFACERPARADRSPGLATPASCHGAGDTAASSCAPAIRTTGSALRAPGMPPVGLAVLPAPPPPVFRVLRPVAVSTQLPRLAPLHRTPLYLLHESLLA